MERMLTETGASAVEYALSVGLIAAVIIVTVGLLGAEVLALLSTVEGEF